MRVIYVVALVIFLIVLLISIKTPESLTPMQSMSLMTTFCIVTNTLMSLLIYMADEESDQKIKDAILKKSGMESFTPHDGDIQTTEDLLYGNPQNQSWIPKKPYVPKDSTPYRYNMSGVPVSEQIMNPIYEPEVIDGRIPCRRIDRSPKGKKWDKHRGVRALERARSRGMCPSTPKDERPKVEYNPRSQMYMSGPEWLRDQRDKSRKLLGGSLRGKKSTTETMMDVWANTNFGRPAWYD